MVTEIGDPIAQKVFKEEIVIRLATGHHNVQEYLIQNRYLDYFTVEELETLLISEEDPNLLVLIISYLIENINKSV